MPTKATSGTLKEEILITKDVLPLLSACPGGTLIKRSGNLPVTCIYSSFSIGSRLEFSMDSSFSFSDGDGGGCIS